MKDSIDFSDCDFAPVMDYPAPDSLHVFDFSKGYDAEYIQSKGWGIGKYNEKRREMYITSQFSGKRNVHMGIDIWADAGEPVYSFYDGEVLYMRDNNRPGDYGPTIVIKYRIQSLRLYALYGHLSRESLKMVSVGDYITKGQKIATLGIEEVNGGWAPHLHFQLSLDDPGEADMPGVVAEENREQALEIYPDPRLVVEDLY